MGQIRNDKLLRLIAIRIKELRMAKGISQDVFFCDTQIHIARIETAKINITVGTLSAICSYLDITLDDFFRDIS